jgi:hypothetical protein
MIIMPSISEKIMKNRITYFICIYSTRIYGRIVSIYIYNSYILVSFIRHFTVLTSFFIFFSLTLELISYIIQNGINTNDNQNEFCPI